MIASTQDTPLLHQKGPNVAILLVTIYIFTVFEILSSDKWPFIIPFSKFLNAVPFSVRDLNSERAFPSAFATYERRTVVRGGPLGVLSYDHCAIPWVMRTSNLKYYV